MSWTVQIKLTRPNTDTVWYTMGDSDKAYFKTNYADTGKRISHTVEGKDGLEKTTTIVYANQTALNEFLADSKYQTFAAAKINHNTSNSISRTLLFNGST